jgi:hypothetical protein
MNVWSVVGMIVGIIMGSFGIIFTILAGGVKRETDIINKALCNYEIDTKANTRRIEVLERQSDVILNELTHINRKLDELITNGKRKRS